MGSPSPRLAEKANSLQVATIVPSLLFSRSSPLSILFCRSGPLNPTPRWSSPPLQRLLRQGKIFMSTCSSTTDPLEYIFLLESLRHFSVTERSFKCKSQTRLSSPPHLKFALFLYFQSVSIQGSGLRTSRPLFVLLFFGGSPSHSYAQFFASFP